MANDSRARFGMVPLSVLTDRRLTAPEVITYAALATYADATRVADATREQLAAITGDVPRTVTRHLAQLVAAGHLEHSGAARRGRGTSYRLTGLPTAVEKAG